MIKRRVSRQVRTTSGFEEEKLTIFQPNVVLINAGTNDANNAVDVANAGNRMEKLLNDIWRAPNMGSTCVFLSTLLPTGNVNGRLNRLPINDQFRVLVKKHAAQGKCIYLAEMATTQYPVEDNEPFDYPREFVDEAHPNVSYSCIPSQRLGDTTNASKRMRGTRRWHPSFVKPLTLPLAQRRSKRQVVVCGLVRDLR